jgi:Tol biopolymer transport system component
VVSLIILIAGVVGVPVFAFTIWRHVTEPSKMQVKPSGNPMAREKLTDSDSSLEKVCFTRGAWIYLRDLVTGQETKLVEGKIPNLAPTGDAIVFLSVKENESVANSLLPPAGRLRILDLQTGKVRDFSALRNVRAVDPIWSNDGMRIAVTIGGAPSNGPYIAVLNARTGNIENKITAGWDRLTRDEGIYLDSWTSGDESILFHTLGALYEVYPELGLVQKITVDEIFKSGEISSATKFSFSSDRRHLLFDRMVDTGESPRSTISLFDLRTRKLVDVSPPAIDARNARWLPGHNEILFVCTRSLETGFSSNICKMALDGTGLSELVTDADYASYSR